MNFNKLAVNECLSETQYYKVSKIVGNDVELENDMGEFIVVDKAYAESCLTSASQFSDSKTITKTEAATMFVANPHVAMTVCFNKQVKEADVVKELLTAYQNATPKTIEAEIKKSVKRGMTGEERIMIGRIVDSEPDEFGRIRFVDMEIPRKIGVQNDGRMRLVDPRTLNWMVLRGTKYIVK